MGTSTDGIIAFGFVCEDGAEFPWGDEKWNDDIDEWWRAVNGYKPPFKLYDSDGEWVDGIEQGDPRIEQYHSSQRAWNASNPVPVSLENYCSLDYPSYAIVVPSSVITCHRGCPEAFDPSKLVVTDDQRRLLEEFVGKHAIEVSGKPSWLLMSYWG